MTAIESKCQGVENTKKNVDGEKRWVSNVRNIKNYEAYKYKIFDMSNLWHSPKKNWWSIIKISNIGEKKILPEIHENRIKKDRSNDSYIIKETIT